MGIRGLESFFDSIYQSASRNSVFTDIPLRDLRLVIDGNHFSYFLSCLFEQNQLTGNYDQYYAEIKNLLAQLAPNIEAVIFDGAKELQAKVVYLRSLPFFIIKE